MRDELAKRVGKRGPFSATFERTGVKDTRFGREVTMLFRDVRDEAGTVVTDHVWFIQGKQARELKLRKGERVQFEATVAPYMKRNPEFEYGDEDSGAYKVRDYRLIYPAKMRREGEKDWRQAPLFSGEQTL